MAASSSNQDSNCLQYEHKGYRPPQYWLKEVTSAEICEEEPLDDNVKLNDTEELERHLVAAKRFKPGTIIMTEKPLVIGPSGLLVQCLGCYRLFKKPEDFAKCNGCGWPVCNTNCSEIGKTYGHSKNECDLLRSTDSKRFLNYNDLRELVVYYPIILPLRCLSLKTNDPPAYDVLVSLNSCYDKRKENPRLWESEQYRVVDKIRKTLGLECYSEAEIHKICGILQVNEFVLGEDDSKVFGLYAKAALMSHNCLPNTYHTDDVEDDFNLIVRASTEIAVDQPITVSKCIIVQSTVNRQQTLLTRKFFSCKCARCQDPTELESYMSALLCPKCKTGWILPLDPPTRESDWACKHKPDELQKECGYRISAEKIDHIIYNLAQTLNNIEWGDIMELETFLYNYRNVLHPTHYLATRVKLVLARSYGRVSGYEKEKLTYSDLNRKISICHELLKLFDIVEPGFTAVRGVILHELYDAELTYTIKLRASNRISEEEFQKRYGVFKEYVEESNFILKYEPKRTYNILMQR